MTADTLQFSGRAGVNPIDRARVVGRAIDRVDGPLKVTGGAHYSYDLHDAAAPALTGFVREAGIARGRIARIETAAAERAPGVRLVLTHRNAPPQGSRADKAFPVFDDDRIRHYGEPIALVVADTFEQARAAAHLIRVTYVAEPGRFDLAAEQQHAVMAKGTVLPLPTPDTQVGDFDGAMAAAPVGIDATYATAPVTHAMMEPYATRARWDDTDGITLWTANQVFSWAYRDLPGTLLLPKEKIRLISTFVGGGFGGKLYVQADAVLAAMAARLLRRPVRIALSRPQMMNMTRHAPATRQRLRLGAGRDGRLVAIGHDVWYANADYGGEPENAAGPTRLLYAGAHRRTTTRQITLDCPVGSAIRGPGERSGLLALEAAMDELAHATGIDPVELRVRNDVAYDPEAGPSKPFATRSLVDCVREGARRFGWSERDANPRTKNDGRWLVGMGMAAAIRRNQVQPSGANITIAPSGRVVVESSTTDIGTGTYTIMAQTAAELLGVPIGDVEVRLADSRMPTGCGSGGSWGGNSATSGLYAACMSLRAQLAEKAGFDIGAVVFQDGHLVSGGRSVALRDAVGSSAISVEGAIAFAEKAVVEASFGSHFCEVGVDRYTAEIRIRRWLTVAEIGRVLNPKTARSQVIGGITFGIGAALTEECVMDTERGLFVNHDLAGYHVPVHADIPELEVHFLDRLEPTSSPMKAKGVGELGACGSGAAVANAVFNATGVRVRDYPITAEKLIAQMRLG